MKRKSLFLGAFVVVTAGVVAAVLLFGLPNLVGNEQANQASLDEAIELASDYVVRHCDEQGQFVYRINLDPGVKVRPGYNILRHAGTIYALAESQQRRPSAEKLDTLRRAADFLRRESIGAVSGQQNMLAVWSRPEINQRNTPVQAKLGGTGLGLVALASVERVAPGTVPLEELQALGRFLVFMQNADGSFCSKFYPGARGRDGRWQSIYYPGEAALGLLMLYEIDPQPIWRETAAKAIAYLARSGREAKQVEPDHWVLLAMARLWPICDECRPPLPRETLLRHAMRICQRMLDDRRQLDEQTSLLGCFTPDGRTCPTATRIEGLTAAMTFLPDEQEPLRGEIRQALGPAIDFLLQSQIDEGPYTGGIPRASGDSKLADLPNKITKREAERRTEIRIDNVQHAISAMIQWEQTEAKKTKPSG